MTSDDRRAALEQALRLKKAAARRRSASATETGPTATLPRRPAESTPGLAPWQRSLWLLQQLEPTSPAYNLVSAYRVPLRLDVDRLQTALDALLRRHRLLRSNFRRPSEQDGVDAVVQEIAPQPEATVETLQAGEPEAAAQTLAVESAQRPFDLAEGPLVRLLVVEEAPGPSVLLVLAMHHLLTDERSLGRLWRELFEAYDQATPPPSAPVVTEDADAVQYDDYVHWLAGQRAEQHATDLAFWRRQLEPWPQPLQLPFERARTDTEEPDARPAGQLLERPLPSELDATVRRVAAAVGTTPFVVFLFVYRLLLQRLTHGDDLALATPVSQRSHPATATMVGYFLNSVLVRGLLDEAQGAAAALKTFAQGLREAMSHGALPFDALVEALAPPRQGEQHPLFQTLFVFQEVPPAPVLDGHQLTPVTLDLGESKFDLTCFVSQGPQGFSLAVEFRTDRFDPVWMGRLLDHYATLATGLVAALDSGERRLATVSMLSPQEESQLQTWSKGEPLDGPSLAGASLVPWQILECVEQSPNAPAVVGSEETWTYRQLAEAAQRVAGALQRFEVGPGDRVALFVGRSPRMLSGLLGILWSGAAYVPLDPTYPESRNRAVLADVEAAAVVLGDTADRTALDSLLDGAPADHQSAGVPPPILVLSEIAEVGEPIERSTALAIQSYVQAGHPIYVVYTSGSTGRPKGVVVSQGGLQASNAARRQVYQDLSAGRFLLLPSLAFDSSVAGLFSTLADGGALVLPSDEEARDPRALGERIRRDRVTRLLCVPSLYGYLLQAGAKTLQSLEAVVVAGERCPPELVAQHFDTLPGCRLFNEYGPTEASVWAAVAELTPADALGSVPLGRPIPGVSVEVLDPKGRRVPAGVPGQGWIHGPTLAEGYWRRPGLTAERFAAAGGDAGKVGARRYATGDRLAWTLDGRLRFLGRVDEQIKLRGFRIEPGEIEAALRTLPGVEEAAVVVREPGQLVAFVAPQRPRQDPRPVLAGRLPEPMVPSWVEPLERLPKLPNGKVDRRQLQQRPLTEATTESGPVTVDALDLRTPALVALWEGLLGRSGIGLDDNFFQLGGHSLLAVELTTAIARDLGVVLAPGEVFQHPTIRGLTQRLAAREDGEAPTYAHLFPIQPTGDGDPLIFAVPHFFSDLLAEQFRGERPVYGLRGVSLRPGGNRGRWPTMEALGVELAEEIQRRFPDRSVFLAGYSFGASMAFEATRQLERAGVTVHRLELIAPMAVDTFHLGPLRWQIDGLRQPVDDLSAPQALGRWLRRNHPLARPLYQRLRRLLVVQPWRRAVCAVGAARARSGHPLSPRVLHADVRLERFRLHTRYRPGRIETPTVVYNPEEPATDAAATWRPFCAGPFTVEPTPDPHIDDASVEATKMRLREGWRSLGA